MREDDLLKPTMVAFAGPRIIPGPPIRNVFITLKGRSTLSKSDALKKLRNTEL